MTSRFPTAPLKPITREDVNADIERARQARELHAALNPASLQSTIPNRTPRTPEAERTRKEKQRRAKGVLTNAERAAVRVQENAQAREADRSHRARVTKDVYHAAPFLKKYGA